MDTKNIPVAIIGAGPVGLAAAAHLAVRGQRFVLFEAGPTVAANVLSWKHVRIFSPWKYNIDRAAKQLLQQSSWQAPAEEELPTGEALYLHYLKPLSELPALNKSIYLHSRVMAVGRKNMDKVKTTGRAGQPYVIQVLTKGEVQWHEAKAVIDVSGTWASPNPVGSGGVHAAGEASNADRIFYGIPDILHSYAERYKSKNVLVVGSGHSAINAILELDKLKSKYPETHVHWVVRKKDVSEIYGGKDADALAARGALGTKIEELVNQQRVNVHTPFQIQQIESKDGQLMISGNKNGNPFVLTGIDEIISTTGSRPDFSFLREIRLDVDASLESVSALAELIDPNVHSCGTVRPHGERELRQPDKDFYIAGSKSYGRAPTFLMATGYEQVRSIVAAIDGDMEAALQVQLDLPQTGVCSGSARAQEKAVKEVVSCCG